MTSVAIRQRLRRLEQAVRKKRARHPINIWDLLTYAVSVDGPVTADQES
jgi:hypothetical protein